MANGPEPSDFKAIQSLEGSASHPVAKSRRGLRSGEFLVTAHTHSQRSRIYKEGA